jgi:lysophospholipase L1-like esterase
MKSALNFFNLALSLTAFVLPIHAAGPNSATLTNSAIEPKSKIENDFYDWNKRHDDVLKAQKEMLANSKGPEIVMIGDSITHMWGGEPKSNVVRGTKAWEATFGKTPILNMGFGWDRTQNVLWRLENGEFEGLAPKWVVLCIGTNNLTGTKNAKENTPAEIVEGILLICDKIQQRAPQAQLIVMGVLPRGTDAKDKFRPKINAINELLAKAIPEKKGIKFLDIGTQLLDADGTLSKEMMPDGVHPSEKAYSIWGKALLNAGVGK